MNETVIQVTSLGKRIKGKTILEEISFEINKGCRDAANAAI